eukprot:1144826-Prorocentrum_minimum.AAC.1
MRKKEEAVAIPLTEYAHQAKSLPKVVFPSASPECNKPNKELPAAISSGSEKEHVCVVTVNYHSQASLHRSTFY